MLTQQRLEDLLHYNPTTGVFRWRVTRSTVKAGAIAGALYGDGYWQIKIDGNRYSSRRLAWLYMTGEFPDHLLTHDNGNRTDDSWDNILESIQVYSPISFKKAHLAMLNTRIGKLETKKELVLLEIAGMTP